MCAEKLGTDYVDYGTAPTTFCNGVARVETDGTSVTFALWRWVTTVIEGRIERKKEVVQYVVTTLAGAQEGIQMAVDALGPRCALADLEPMPSIAKFLA